MAFGVDILNRRTHITLSCADIDECAYGHDDCNAGQTCVNTDGSFECQGGAEMEV